MQPKRSLLHLKEQCVARAVDCPERIPRPSRHLQLHKHRTFRRLRSAAHLFVVSRVLPVCSRDPMRVTGKAENGISDSLRSRAAATTHWNNQKGSATVMTVQLRRAVLLLGLALFTMSAGLVAQTP